MEDKQESGLNHHLDHRQAEPLRKFRVKVGVPTFAAACRTGALRRQAAGAAARSAGSGHGSAVEAPDRSSAKQIGSVPDGDIVDLQEIRDKAQQPAAAAQSS